MKRLLVKINFPNILTVARILVTPLFVILLIREHFDAAFLVFIIASVSDGLDGFLARWLDNRTELGALLDPMADKVLLVSAFATLAIMNIVPGWLTVVVISRDIMIALGIVVFMVFGVKYRIRPSWLSKCTTTAQLVFIMIIMMGRWWESIKAAHEPMMWLTACLTIVSGLHYVVVGLRLLQPAANERHNTHD